LLKGRHGFLGSTGLAKGEAEISEGFRELGLFLYRSMKAGDGFLTVPLNPESYAQTGMGQGEAWAGLEALAIAGHSPFDLPQFHLGIRQQGESIGIVGQEPKGVLAEGPGCIRLTVLQVLLRLLEESIHGIQRFRGRAGSRPCRWMLLRELHGIR
jgi:hypothetical protein